MWEKRVMSRDMQVRVVFYDWLAWLMCMKKCRHDVSLKSVSIRQEHGHTSTEDNDDTPQDAVIVSVLPSPSSSKTESNYKQIQLTTQLNSLC